MYMYIYIYIYVYALFGLSNLKDVKSYPTMTKNHVEPGFTVRIGGVFALDGP